MEASAVVSLPIKTCPPSIRRSDDQSCQSLCGERIRFGEEGTGNSQCLRPATVRSKRKPTTKTKGKTWVMRCASLWRRVQRPLRRPKPPRPGCIQCHCLSGVCDPRSRMSLLCGRKDKPAKAETPRIEEGVAALFCFCSSQIPRGEEDAPPNYTGCLHSQHADVDCNVFHRCARAASSGMLNASRFLSFALEGSFQSLIQSGSVLVVFLLGDVALLAVNLELEEFFLKSFQQDRRTPGAG